MAKPKRKPGIDDLIGWWMAYEFGQPNPVPFDYPPDWLPADYIRVLRFVSKNPITAHKYLHAAISEFALEFFPPDPAIADYEDD